MGVTTLPRVVESLLAGGMAPDTPAAMVERGTTAAQRSLVSTLAGLPDAVSREGLAAPALFVVGPTVARADRLDWFRRQPLAGERLVVAAAATDLVRDLETAGAEVIAAPSPMTPAARIVIGAAPLTGCVIRSPAEAEWLDDERETAGWEARPVAWCVGQAAAGRARELGWRQVRQVGDGAGSAGLVEQIERARRGVA
jgi:uroporphyrinogen III methyltransferase/synthase